MASTSECLESPEPKWWLTTVKWGCHQHKADSLHFHVQKCFIRFSVVKVLGFFGTSLFVSEERCGRSSILWLCWPHRLVIDVNHIAQSSFSQQKTMVMLNLEKVTLAWESMVLLVFAATPIFWDALDHGQNISSRGMGVTAAFVIYLTYMPGIHFCFKWLTRVMTEWRNGFEHHLVILYLFVVGPSSSRGRPDVSLNIFPIIMIMTCNDHKMKMNSVLDQFIMYKHPLTSIQFPTTLKWTHYYFFQLLISVIKYLWS